MVVAPLCRSFERHINSLTPNLLRHRKVAAGGVGKTHQS